MAGNRRPNNPGFVIKKCTVPGTVAIGFDDGPWFYTTYVLDVLKRFNAHATFFILPTPRVLDNPPAVDDIFLGENEPHWAPIVRRIHHDGHQVALHGYAHEHFDAMAPFEVLSLLERSAMHFARPNYLDGLGPMYVRPPWGECNDADEPNGCLMSLMRAGYRVVFWDTDPRDWENDSEFEIHRSKDIVHSKLYDEAADPSRDSFLLVSHDVHLQTAVNMTEAVLQMIEKQGYRAVTVGECVGETSDKWYRSVGAHRSTSQALRLPIFPAKISHAAISFGTFVVLVGMLLWALSIYRNLRHRRAIRRTDLFRRAM